MAANIIQSSASSSTPRIPPPIEPCKIDSLVSLLASKTLNDSIGDINKLQFHLPEPMDVPCSFSQREKNKALCEKAQIYILSLNLASKTWPNRNGSLDWLSPQARDDRIEDLRISISTIFDNALLEGSKKGWWPKDATESVFDGVAWHRFYQLLIQFAIEQRVADCGILSLIGYQFLQPQMKGTPIGIYGIERQPGVSEHYPEPDHQFIVIGDPEHPDAMICDLWAQTSFLYRERERYLKDFQGVDERGNPFIRSFDSIHMRLYPIPHVSL